MTDAVGYFDSAAAMLATRYNSVRFADVHADIVSRLPTGVARVLDVGAGSGRDARALAALGHHVTAVEPAAGLRSIGEACDCGVSWIDDRLPSTLR